MTSSCKWLIGSQRGPETFIQRCQERKASRVEVRFVDESNFANKGNGFVLNDWSRLGARLHHFVGVE